MVVVEITKSCRTWQAAEPLVGRLTDRSIAPNPFWFSAIPSIGFTHGLFQRSLSQAQASEPQRVQHCARLRCSRAADLVDLSAAAFVTMAVAFGPLLAWLILA